MMDHAVFTVDRDLNHQRVTYTLQVDAIALSEVRLDEVERRMLRECDGPDSTIADKLLALEMLMRRMQEQHG